MLTRHSQVVVDSRTDQGVEASVCDGQERAYASCHVGRDYITSDCSDPQHVLQAVEGVFQMVGARARYRGRRPRGNNPVGREEVFKPCYVCSRSEGQSSKAGEVGVTAVIPLA